MKTIKLGLLAFIIATITACGSNDTKSYTNYDDALADVKESIAEAKSANYEWRDTGKLVKKAEKLNAEGKVDDALKTLAKAKEQAVLAVAQAKQQANVAGPY